MRMIVNDATTCPTCDSLDVVTTFAFGSSPDNRECTDCGERWHQS